MALVLTLSACVSENALPSLRPLIGGLDESKVPQTAKVLLAHARVDFKLMCEGRPPRYALPAGTIPGTHSKVYQGENYRLTLVDSQYSNVRLLGPEIVLGDAITHAGPYKYDEIARLNEVSEN